MQAGRLNRLITIQRNTQTSGEDGHPSDSWAAVGALRRHASLRPLRGEERFTAPQFVATEQVEFRIRYADTVAELTPLDRVIYPALTEAEFGSSPVFVIPTRRMYDIIAAHEIGLREGVQIFASRRADVTT